MNYTKEEIDKLIKQEEEDYAKEFAVVKSKEKEENPYGPNVIYNISFTDSITIVYEDFVSGTKVERIPGPGCLIQFKGVKAYMIALKDTNEIVIIDACDIKKIVLDKKDKETK